MLYVLCQMLNASEGSLKPETTNVPQNNNPKPYEAQMIKHLSFVFALACFTLIGCGGSVDMRSIMERLDRAEARATEAEEENARLERDRADLMAGREPASETSGGETTSVVASAPVAPIVGGGPIMTPVATGMPGVLQMCDGVDGAGMLTSGMLTSTMAFSTGSEPWGAYTMDGMDYLVQNNSIFDVAIAIDGRVVHTFAGGTPLMVSDTSGMCAMPAIPRRNGMSPTSMRIPLVDGADRPEHEIQYFCYRTAGGRLATAPAWRGTRTFYMGGGRQWQITNADCGQPGTP
jgi:hypothetical protein